VVTAVLGESFDEIAYLAFGFFLYLTAQGVAICATTVLQEDTDDSYRGRLFAFYDVMFNVSLAAGALLSAVFMPLNGRSAAIIGAVAAGYAVAAAGYWLLSRQASPPSPGGPGPSRPPAAAQSSST
jgi:predicted MFS family arabinose efflux permease